MFFGNFLVEPRYGSTRKTVMPSMIRQTYVLLVATCCLLVIAGSVLFWLSDNPFHLFFRIGLWLGGLGGGGLSVLLLTSLLQSRWRTLRVLAIAVIVLGVCAALALAALLHRARWLSPAELSPADWQADAAYLRDLIPRVHPHAFAHVSKESFDAESSAMLTRILRMDDEHAEMALVRLVAALEDGHSTLFPFQPATGFRMLPLQIYLFSDGWYVIDASPTYSSLSKKRLVAIGTQSTDEAFATIRPFVGADNEATVEDRAPWYLLCPEVLHALGLTPSSDVVHITVVNASGVREEVDVRPVALISYLYWFFQPLQEWKRHPSEDHLPLYRQRMWDNYRFTDVGDGVVYVAFNQVRDKSHESFETFGAKVLRYCEDHHTQRLIIDVRNNSGGDNTIFSEFIEKVRKSRMNERGRLFLIIGRHTFSAAVNFTSAIEGKTNAILVGESAGAGPNHSGDPKRYILPHSRLWVFIASRPQQWGTPDDVRRSHEPQITVPLTHSDYFAGRDPVLEAITALQIKGAYLQKQRLSDWHIVPTGR
jgi:hypothetical protein